MRRGRPTLFHTLKGVRGWSDFYINPLDVRNIININYRRRWFMLTAYDRPWSMRIDYYNPHSSTTSIPVMTTNGHIGIGFTSRYSESSLMTLRYETEQEILEELAEINKLWSVIEKYDAQESRILESQLQKSS